MVHAQAEAYITGREKVLHADLFQVKVLLNKLKAGYQKRTVRVEVELAVDKAWRPVEWFSKDAWLRAKLDVFHFPNPRAAKVIDWKTGRFKPGPAYEDQLSIYSTVAMCAFDMVAGVAATLVFTDGGEVVDSKVMLRSELPEAKQRWAKRALPLFNDTAFAPTPSMTCRWCNFSRNKGGPCQF